MSVIKEFKEFALKGNVLDMAIGVIIGGAFGKIVSSLVSDIMMPPLGLLTGGLDLSALYINLSPSNAYETLDAAIKAGAPVLRIGIFVNAIIDFTIIAFVIFLFVRFVNRLKRETPPSEIEPTRQEKLLMEIRDALRAR